MSQHHYIYVNESELTNPDDEIHVRVHYLIGYCDQTITQYQKMADHLRESFPEATDDKIHCHQIHKSISVNRFTLICWSGRVKKSRIGLPDAKEYKKMVERKDYHGDFPHLPQWGEWWITQRNCDYYY